MDNFDFSRHPNELFDKWYLQSQGRNNKKGVVQSLQFKFQYLLKFAFTQIVPALDRMDYNAMVLATASKNGQPSSRVVLLKEYDDHGYVFYTNYESEKSKDLLENPVASLNFFWAYPTRQVRITGDVEKVSYEQSQAYWDSRPRGSQEGALASMQSHKIENYNYLKKELKSVKKKFDGQPIPCPQHWGGFRVKPNGYEFWQAMPNRLHQRVKFDLVEDKWIKSYLAP